MSRLAYAALWAFAASVPLEGVFVSGGVAIATRLTGTIAAVLALLATVMSGRFRRWHTFHVAALFFVIWAGSVFMFLSESGRMPNKFWTFVQLFAVVLMMWELTLSRKALNGLLLAYVLGAYVTAIDTIRAYQTADEVMRRFVAGTFDPNDLAMTLALGVPMAWYLGMTFRRPAMRWLCRAYLPLAVLAIGLTGSRGGMVVCMVSLTVVPLTMRTLSPGRLVTALAMLLLSGALAAVYVPETVVERLASTQAEVEEGSFGGRFKLWKAGFRAFSQRPVVGYGTSMFIPAITPILGPASQVAHNSYLSVLVEEGLVGFFLYGTMVVSVFLAVRRLPFTERRFGLVLMATLALAMFPLTWEHRKSVWFTLAALLSLSQWWIGRRQPLARSPGAHPNPAAPEPAVVARPVAARSARRGNFPRDTTT
jgi:hypothetical protein